MKYSAFQKIVWDYYRKYGRDLPWRNTKDAYRITVSEIMLQQTQVERVIPYYERFIKKFPSFKALARAPVNQVLLGWQGLGYNRRALNLQKLAQIVAEQYKGKLPDTVEELDALPGIGKGTAGSLSAFVFNKPVAFIETNIRRVFIHHFFADKKVVHDEDILKLVEKTADKKNAREWYYALMDYGSHLRKKVENPNRKSAHYSKQSKFEGSDRQLRGELLRNLLRKKEIDVKQFAKAHHEPVARVKNILIMLREEGFLN
jgi:A/G-specific adenine glycosylase